MEREKITHESYGQIRFSRINGHNRFYGSELEQDNYIELNIDSSECEKDLANDWHYSTKNLVSLRMTSNQFAELITSMNIGSGVPCTLEYINGVRIAPLPKVENRKEVTHRQFKDRMVEFSTTIKDRQAKAKELVKKKTLSKDDVISLSQHIDWLTTEISNNIPFFMECFQETMDKVVNEAKSEIESAIQHKITTLGLAELHKQNNLLNGGE